jgi:hypothetical protein
MNRPVLLVILISREGRGGEGKEYEHKTDEPLEL